MNAASAENCEQALKTIHLDGKSYLCATNWQTRCLPITSWWNWRNSELGTWWKSQRPQPSNNSQTGTVHGMPLPNIIQTLTVRGIEQN